MAISNEKKKKMFLYNWDISGMGYYAHNIEHCTLLWIITHSISVLQIVCPLTLRVQYGTFIHIYKIYKRFVIKIWKYFAILPCSIQGLLSHLKNMWLFLFPDTKEIISIFDGLESYFLFQISLMVWIFFLKIIVLYNG